MIAALNDKRWFFDYESIHGKTPMGAKEIINGISNKELSEQEKKHLSALIQNECVAQGAAL